MQRGITDASDSASRKQFTLSGILIRLLFSLFAALCVVPSQGWGQTPTPPELDPAQVKNIKTYEAYIATLNAQINQYQIGVEKEKTNQLQAQARGDTRGAKAYEAQMKVYQLTVTVKKQEVTLYQQMITLEREPRSPIPAVNLLKDQIKQLTLDKGRLLLAQTSATQAGGPQGQAQAQLAQIQAQIKQKDAALQAKKQEIKLIELQTKSSGGSR